MPRGVLLLTAAALAIVLAARAEEPMVPQPADLAPGKGWEAAAETLQRATVTVRIWAAAKDAEPAPDAVTVCSGVCVGEGRVVTAALVGSDSRIRLTLAGGKQADAKVQVVDEYSGLALLKCDTSLVPLEFAATAPAVGGQLLTAAAWGTDPPLVSQGIVGGVDRTKPGVVYPPLLQCDVRTMQTSTGSGLVDAEGKLVGIVVAADAADGRRGWTYAVGVSHVERLLRVADGKQGDGVVVLKRRRPLVGMVLDQADEAIVVSRLIPDGPAAAAGIELGDQVLAVDGVLIRSVTQAVLPTIYKQPGDTTTFRVQRKGGVRDIEVTLGGGVELSSAPLDFLAGVIQPKVEMARDASGAIVRRERAASVREVSVPPLPDDEPPAAARPTTAEKIALLEKALDRYQAVVELQQKQLQQEQKQRAEQQQVIESLRSELDELRKTIKGSATP